MELDDEQTWPPSLRSLFESNFKELASFERARASIDTRAQSDLRLRLNPPRNPHELPHERATDQVLCGARAVLHGQSLVGWHCARLHSDEVAHIRAAGLRPLEAELLLGRIERRLTAGDISALIATKLRQKHQAADVYR